MQSDPPNPRLEIAFALVLIAFAGVIYWGTLGLPAPRFEPLGSASVPRMLAGIMAALSAVWLALSIRRLRQETAKVAPDTLEPSGAQGYPLLALAVFVLTIIFVAVMDLGLLGFVAAGIPYVVVCGFFLTHRSIRKLPWVVGYAVILVFAVNYIFTEFFYINLP